MPTKPQNMLCVYEFCRNRKLTRHTNNINGFSFKFFGKNAVGNLYSILYLLTARRPTAIYVHRLITIHIYKKISQSFNMVPEDIKEEKA
jgi:hypothetical protein